MSESHTRRPEEPEKNVAQRSAEFVRQSYALLKELAAHPEIRTGAEATMRTAINAFIAIGDAIPGYGALGSWGADGAKILARWHYHKRLKEVTQEGISRGLNKEDAQKEAAEKVKLSAVDLTPDVSVTVAVATEGLEVFGFGAVPTHSIEGFMQMRHDWPKMRTALTRILILFKERGSPSGDVRNAANVFDVTL